MSHNDTWDPKPESGREYMGELMGTVETNVSGIRLDRTAQRANRSSGERLARWADR